MALVHIVNDMLRVKEISFHKGKVAEVTQS